MSDDHLRGLLAEWQGTLDDLGEEADLLVRAAERVVHRQAESGIPYWNDASPEQLRQYLGVLVDDEAFMTLVRAKQAFAAIYLEDLDVLDALAEDVVSALEAAIRAEG